jgi:drug/metabolite transporter (DMT)-like permease
VTASFVFIGAFAVLIGVASVIEGQIARGLPSVQLNFLIRAGSLAAAAVALVAVHGIAVPSGAYALGGLAIGLITGVGSIIYCLALIKMPISLVVTLSNLYIVITALLGVVILREPLTALKIAGLASTLVGVLLLAYPPSSRYGVHSATSTANKAPPPRAFLTMGAYLVIIGVGAFLEKPALRGLDATQLNGMMAIAMTAVAGVALVIEGPSLPMTKRSLAVVGVGGMIGVASVFYFLGLNGLPVSVAAASSNSAVIVTVLISTIFLRQRLSLLRGGAMVMTLLGVTLLAVSAG